MRRSSLKINLVVKQATQHWKYVEPLLTYPRNDAQYDLLVQRLDQLLDIIGEDEKHALMGLVDILSNLISSYDEKHFPIRVKGAAALKYLMQLRGYNQIDLQEIGSQGVVSEILNGKRELNLRQIKILSKLFKVSPITFIDD